MRYLTSDHDPSEKIFISNYNLLCWFIKNCYINHPLLCSGIVFKHANTHIYNTIVNSLSFRATDHLRTHTRGRFFALCSPCCEISRHYYNGTRTYIKYTTECTYCTPCGIKKERANHKKAHLNLISACGFWNTKNNCIKKVYIFINLLLP